MKQTKTPAFRRWFGDSKVVDANGEPLVVWHFVESDFAVFDMNKTADIGMHFGTYSAAKDAPRSSYRGKVKPFFLKIENFIAAKDPNDWTGTDEVARQDLNYFSKQSPNVDHAFIDQIFENGIITEEEHELYQSEVRSLRDPFSLSSKISLSKTLRELLLSKGIDGIVYLNKYEDEGELSWIVFSPTQIKSATDNNGDFDPTNPDVRKNPMRRRAQPNKPMSSQELQEELMSELASPVDAYDFFPYFKQYAEEKGLDPDDPHTVMENTKAAAKFMEWVEENDILTSWIEDDPTSIPPKIQFSRVKPLPAGTWLIHHSNAEIEEFDRGVDFEHLVLSTWLEEPLRRGQLNLDDSISFRQRIYAFAFQPKDDPAIRRDGRPGRSNYGNRWYLFHCDAAVSAYHQLDGESQVIFPVGTEYDLVEIYAQNDGWSCKINGNTVEGRTFSEFLGRVEEAMNVSKNPYGRRLARANETKTPQAFALLQLLALLRAVYSLHQAHHWDSKGPTYYGDHLLFQRLYEGITPEIDAVAERAVGAGGEVEYVSQSSVKTQILSNFEKQEREAARTVSPADARVVASLEAEKTLLAFIDQVLASGASQGTQNLLQGIADKHEGHVYLLQQRLGVE